MRRWRAERTQGGGCADGARNAHRVLVYAKADIDRATTNDGETPAYMAAWNGHACSLQVLVRAKADIHKATTFDGETPAFVAANKGDILYTWQKRALLDKQPQVPTMVSRAHRDGSSMRAAS